MKNTLRIVWTLLEVAAALRAGIATYTVVSIITDGNIGYTLFTVIIVEGVFVASLFMMQEESVAPIAALLALCFSGAMQWLELIAVAGELTDSDKMLLRGVVAFAPIVILALAYLRRLVPDEVVREKIAGLVDAVKPKSAEGKPQTEQIPQPAKVVTVHPEVAANGNGRDKSFP